MPTREPDPEKQAKAREAARRADEWDVNPECYEGKPETSELDDISWVRTNLRNQQIKLEDAPSASAMNLLLDAREDKKTWLTELFRLTAKLADARKSQENTRRSTLSHTERCVEVLANIRRTVSGSSGDKSRTNNASQGTGGECSLSPATEGAGGERLGLQAVPVDAVPE